DSVALFIEDTLRAGRGACDPALVETLCRESVALAGEFPWDSNADGSFAMLRPLGCSVPRCVSIGHRIGAWALAKIRRELAANPRFTEVRGRVTALRRLPDGGFEAEVWAADAAPCKTRAVSGAAQDSVAAPSSRTRLVAKSVVLATGGWCGRYAFSDNPADLDGAGIALAQSLGADVRDMDAVQLEPTVALAPAAVRGIPVITTMLHEGATFRNRDGAEFLPDKHATKEALSEAILAEIAAGRGVEGNAGCTMQNAQCTRHSSGSDAGVWFDATGVAPEVLRTRYADTYNRYAAAGVDITREPMLVAPAPHTSLGGLCIDTRCRVLAAADGAPIPGLFAAGECVGGIHGRGRLGGNAGTEVLVFGRIAGREAAML
ncbi:MAG: FAD-binding protein, partial [Kiritimatiellae bacterium]|nr:FAD-binding protein [Kiritimatiellia bacterium]